MIKINGQVDKSNTYNRFSSKNSLSFSTFYQLKKLMKM